MQNVDNMMTCVAQGASPILEHSATAEVIAGWLNATSEMTTATAMHMLVMVNSGNIPFVECINNLVG